MRLLDQDIQPPKSDPETWESLVADCALCTSKVREKLHGSGVTDTATLEAIERVYTAALLAQLWRDVRVDVMAHGRLYVPVDLTAACGLDLALMRKALNLDTERGSRGDARDGSCNCAIMPNSAMRVVLPAYRIVMHELVRRTELLFEAGWQGSQGIPDDERRVLRNLAMEGRVTLRLITRRDYDTLTRRHQLGAVSRALLGVRQRIRI